MTGRLTDTAGAPLAGRTIQLSTGSGSLNSSSAVTDQNGTVTVTLTGSASTTVRASASGIDAALDVPAVAPFTVGLDSKYSVIQPGESVEMYIIVTAVPGIANPPTPSTVTLACGNGQTVAVSVVLGERRTATCTYRERDSYVATVTTTTANGWSTTASTRVTADPKPVSITLTAREVARGAGDIEMELIAVGAPERSVCSWEMGEGSKPVGACNQNWVYTPGDTASDGSVTVKVTVKPSTGADPVTAEIKFFLSF